MKLAGVFEAIVLSGAVFGAPVDVAVTVTDHDGQAVEGATVFVAFEVTEEPQGQATTDLAGKATILIDVPNQPLIHGWVFVTGGSGEEKDGFRAIRRWKFLARNFQFSGRGTPFSVVLGQPTVNVAVQASETIEIVGVAVGGDADLVGRSVAGASGLPPLSGSPVHGTGEFTVHVPRSWPLFTVSGTSWVRFVTPQIPPGAPWIDVGRVDLNPPLGKLAGALKSTEDLGRV